MTESAVDAIRLNFNQDNVFLLNICLAFIMYGVALDLRPADFMAVVKFPKSVLVGILSQFVVLPLLTYGLVVVLQPQPSIALGMMLVAACPGGNVSNFMTALSRGNTALSVSLTAFSTALCIFFTPFNLAFWGSMYEPTAQILRTVAVDRGEVTQTIALILGIPLVAGMLTLHFAPTVAGKLQRVIKPVSILIFAALIVVALASNLENMANYLHLVVLLVLLHNGIALASGYGLGAMARLQEADRRSLAIETGIQNSGLGLLLIFSFFEGLGGMALVAAWWGIWHLVSGMTMASIWSGGLKRLAAWRLG